MFSDGYPFRMRTMAREIRTYWGRLNEANDTKGIGSRDTKEQRGKGDMRVLPSQKANKSVIPTVNNILSIRDA